MQTSVHCAVQTLLDYDIRTLPLLSNDIETAIKSQGFDIISFDIPLEQSYIEDFEELGISDIALTHKAFTYADNENRYVFFRASLSLEEKRFLLAHELGHIRLGHIVSGVRCSSEFNDKTPQEKEANEFAVELLAPTCILKNHRNLTPEKISHLTLLERSKAENVFFKVKHHKTNTEAEQKLCNAFDIKKSDISKYIKYFVAAVCVCVMFIIFYENHNNADISYINATPQPTQQISASNTTVVITKSGTKYHLPECQHVKYKTDVIEMPKEEAIRLDYEPCKVCNP